MATIALACLALAFGCTPGPEETTAWKFGEDAVRSSPPPDDTYRPPDTSIPPDAPNCPDDLQERDGTCDRSCAHVDPDCGNCPDPEDPTIRYVGNSYDNPSRCMLLDYVCQEGWTEFHRRLCGCGCRKKTEENCSPDDPCGSEEWCDYPDEKCGEGQPGVCRDRPPGCPEHNDPVCACNGQSYTNPCKAHLDGQDKRFNGRCP